MSEFKVGDTVRFKGPSPVMTVIGVGESEAGQNVEIAWFDDGRRMHKATFSGHVLAICQSRSEREAQG